MRNDAVRKAFVENDENWQTLYEIPRMVQLQKLQYGLCEWFRVRIFQIQNRFDYEKREPYQVADWGTVQLAKWDKEHDSLSGSMSVTQIVKEIQSIDREVKDEQ